MVWTCTAGGSCQGAGARHSTFPARQCREHQHPHRQRLLAAGRRLSGAAHRLSWFWPLWWRPRLPAVLADIRAAFAWLRREPAAADLPLFLLGQSIGASLGGFLVGTDAALRSALCRGARRRLCALRLDRPRSVGTQSADLGSAMADRLEHAGRFRSGRCRGRHQPGAGTSHPWPCDDIVRYHHAQALFDAAREPRFLLSYDGPHIGSFQDEQIRQAVVRFFADSVHNNGTAASREHHEAAERWQAGW